MRLATLGFIKLTFNSTHFSLWQITHIPYVSTDNTSEIVYLSVITARWSAKQTKNRSTDERSPSPGK